jgi:hypothetical protein
LVATGLIVFFKGVVNLVARVRRMPEAEVSDFDRYLFNSWKMAQMLKTLEDDAIGGALSVTMTVRDGFVILMSGKDDMT